MSSNKDASYKPWLISYTLLSYSFCRLLCLKLFFLASTILFKIIKFSACTSKLLISNNFYSAKYNKTVYLQFEGILLVGDALQGLVGQIRYVYNGEAGFFPLSV